ncbi:hypothetical protein [Enterobacter kobei]|uniref:hypothetical protein n=1 Tax=Enterobacter kobei TaxID=208224 RepID=UPI0021C1828B|nr:hypothetical protein [Enterobacter kobei]UXJ66684.1 hypothetical protein N5P26_22700 [Enterobacter kobei]
MSDDKQGWPFHIENYTKMALETGVSIAAYAEMYGLNPNTCRRHLRKPNDTTPSKNAKKLTSKPLITDQPTDLLADKSVIRQSKPKRQPKKNIQMEETLTHERPLAGGKGVFDKDGKLIRFTKARRGSIDTQFKSGNTANVRHGAYATPTEHDIAQAQHLIATGIMDSIDEYLISHNLAHLLLISRSRDRSLEIFNEQERALEMASAGGSKRKNKKRDDDEPVREEIPPEFKKLSMLVNASDAIASITRNISSVRQVLDKRRKEEEKRDLEGDYREAIVNAYRLQDERNWSALETATHIERQGFKVPATLAIMVQNELKLPPPVDDTPLVDDEQLDKEARAYRDKQRAALEFRERRQQEVAEIVDKRGYGDFDQNGELRADMDYGYDEEDSEEWDDDDTPSPWDESGGDSE